ncbi:MAG: hypothetical protein JRI23_25030, partial [Deltaproteobacteria bacterium]|nr:hypothetical protein [Deltaproteobacteria bacterium]MBW2535281.1 hypothetical protein [Deltaproteobacteria bacterium]
TTDGGAGAAGGGATGGSGPDCGLRVFPGAEGFGTTTRAAYGDPSQDPVGLTVDTLSPTGAGSLDEALRDPRPRVIVFEVSGTIQFDAAFVIRDPYVTVAGQTAPSPGITIAGGILLVRTHDVLVQHLRIRPGDDPNGVSGENRDALSLADSSEPVHDVVVDHCSLSWSTDEVAQSWYQSHHNTFSSCIFSEALENSIHPEGAHSMGPLIGSSSHHTTLVRSLLMSNRHRNPRIACGQLAAVNNLIYNPGNAVFEFDAYTSGDETLCNDTWLTCIGNVAIAGPSTNASYLVRTNEANPGTQLYLEDNVDLGEPFRNNSSFDPLVTVPPVAIECVTVRSSSDVEAFVVANVGARPTDRDAVDQRLMNEIADRQGQIIDSQDDVGGWPTLAENQRSLSPPADLHGDDDGDGYTNLEEWLHCFLEEVEPRTIPGCSSR